MVGLGESFDELRSTITDIRNTGCEILTIGQYLSPSRRHIPVERYYAPEEFEMIKKESLAIGFTYVESGALVRSSYHASHHTCSS
jgi:lipoic acid synthetase